MNLLETTFAQVQGAFARDFTMATLKFLIVAWAIMVIFVTIFVVRNKWVLAGILAYEVLP